MKFKSIIAIVLAIILAFSMTGCISFNPCEKCGDIPTRGYTNTGTGETEYYCSECSGTCVFCGDRATKNYTNMLHMIMFVCSDCYEKIAE